MPDDEAKIEVLSRYTLLDGSHSFRGRRAHKGQEILLTDKEAQKLANRVRRSAMADEKGSDKVTETAKPTYTPVTAVSETTEPTIATASVTPRDWSKSQDMKAVDVIAQVNETSTVEDLEALYDIEEKGQNRVTVLREIEKKVAQLEGEGK